MNYESAIASGVRELDVVRQFENFFPDAEHFIVQAKRDFDPDGWQLVNEWISRAHVHDRYVIWLVVAIDVAPNGGISALDEPEVYIVEVETVQKGRDDEDGPKWECSFGELEDGAWKEIVADGGTSRLYLNCLPMRPSIVLIHFGVIRVQHRANQRLTVSR